MGDELTLPLAFMTGLAGAGHCWTMCGGLVGGLFVGRGCAGGACQSGGAMLQPHLGYHAGRVLAYTLLGALASGIGQAIVLTGGVGLAQAVLYIVAGGLVVLSGARVADVPSPALPRTPPPLAGEGLGEREAVLAPLGRVNRLANVVSRVRQVYPIAGFLNGLMPCALVFSLTLKAATAPSVATGAAWLFVFGLGTVPAMALAGGLAHWLGAQALRWLRRAAGVLVIGLGLQAIWAGYKFFQVMLHL
jgi:sulfite exporter TauE/SafE